MASKSKIIIKGGCKCCDQCKGCKGGEFQQIVDLQESGVVIYRHYPTGDLSNETDETQKEETTAQNLREVFIIHNKKDNELIPADLMAAYEKNRICCRKCHDRTRKYLEALPMIKRNDAKGVCDFCCIKNESRGACARCEAILKKFLQAIKEQNEQEQDENQSHVSRLLRKIHNSLKFMHDEGQRRKDERIKKTEHSRSDFYLETMYETSRYTLQDQISEKLRNNRAKSIPRDCQVCKEAEDMVKSLETRKDRGSMFTKLTKGDHLKPYEYRRDLSDFNITEKEKLQNIHLQKKIESETDPLIRPQLEEELRKLEQDLLKKNIKQELDPRTQQGLDEQMEHIEQESLKRKNALEQNLEKKQTLEEQLKMRKQEILGNEQDPRKRHKLQSQLQEEQQILQELDILKRKIDREPDPQKRQKLEEKLRIYKQDFSKKKFKHEQDHLKKQELEEQMQHKELETIKRKIFLEQDPKIKQELKEQLEMHKQDLLKKRIDNEQDHRKWLTMLEKTRHKEQFLPLPIGRNADSFDDEILSLSAIQDELPKVFQYFFPPKDKTRKVYKAVSSTDLIKDTQDKLIAQAEQERIKKEYKLITQEQDMVRKQIERETDPKKRQELEEKLDILEQELLKKKMAWEQDPQALQELEQQLKTQEQEVLMKKIANEKDPRKRQELQLQLQEEQRRIQEQETLKEKIDREPDPRKRQKLVEELRIHEQESLKRKIEQEKDPRKKQELEEQIQRKEQDFIKRKIALEPDPKKKLALEEQLKMHEQELLRNKIEKELDPKKIQVLEEQMQRKEQELIKKKIALELDPTKKQALEEQLQMQEQESLRKKIVNEQDPRKRQELDNQLRIEEQELLKKKIANEKDPQKKQELEKQFKEEQREIREREELRKKIQQEKDPQKRKELEIELQEKQQARQARDYLKSKIANERDPQKRQELEKQLKEEQHEIQAQEEIKKKIAIEKDPQKREQLEKQLQEKQQTRQIQDALKSKIASERDPQKKQELEKQLKEEQREIQAQEEMKKKIATEKDPQTREQLKKQLQEKQQTRQIQGALKSKIASEPDPQKRQELEKQLKEEQREIQTQEEIKKKIATEKDPQKREQLEKRLMENQQARQVQDALKSKIASERDPQKKKELEKQLKEEQREKQEQDELKKKIATEKDLQKREQLEKQLKEKQQARQVQDALKSKIANERDPQKKQELEKQFQEEQRLTQEKDTLRKKNDAEKDPQKKKDLQDRLNAIERKAQKEESERKEAVNIEKDTAKKGIGKDEIKTQPDNAKKQNAEEDKLPKVRDAAEKITERDEEVGVKLGESKKPVTKLDSQPTAIRQEGKETAKKGKDDTVLANKMLTQLDKTKQDNIKQRKAEEEKMLKAREAAEKVAGQEIKPKTTKAGLPQDETIKLKEGKKPTTAVNEAKWIDKDTRKKGSPKDEIALANKMLSQLDKAQQDNMKQRKAEEEKMQKAREAADKTADAKDQRGKLIGDEIPKKDLSPVGPSKKEPDKKSGKETEVNLKSIQLKQPSGDDLILKLVQTKRRDESPKLPPPAPTVNLSDIIKKKRKKKDKSSMANLSDLELDRASVERKKAKVKEPESEIIYGNEIYPKDALPSEPKKIEDIPKLFKSTFNQKVLPSTSAADQSEEAPASPPEDAKKGILRYALSDPTFIEKGWTLLPTEKVVRKMNVYRMRPARPEFDWFEHNKNKKLMFYDTGEKLAEFDDDGRGRWYYKNGRIALDYYDAEEVNAQQRFVIYSSGELDDRGRSHPITVLGMFDYLGNGVVFDHGGKTRLKYNQTEGVVLDRDLGPVSNWKWHSLNDPPVLQQVMIDTHLAHKDPDIMKLGNDDKTRSDNEEMLAIEFDNFIKEKSKKSSQTFQPFQIRMKALKINDNFSLRVLDQATIYLLFRDGSTNLKLNMGMVLDHQEIVDTDISEVGEVSTNVDRLPAASQSVAELQATVKRAQAVERARAERQRRLRRPVPVSSVDRLTAAAARPRPTPPPLNTIGTDDGTSSSAVSRSYTIRRKPSNNLYYDTRLI